MKQLRKTYQVWGLGLLLVFIAGSLPIYADMLSVSHKSFSEEKISDYDLTPEIKSSGFTIENMYDFSKGFMQNVTIDEYGCLSLEIDDWLAPVWAPLNPSTRPSPRRDASMVYNPDANQVILFGGYDGSYLDDMWIYEIRYNSWALMSPFTKPSARSNASIVYDSAARQVVLFGGINSGGVNDETWAFDLFSNSWTNMNPATKPSARQAQAMVFDSAARKIVLFGGEDGDWDDETWTYDLATNTWTNMTPSTKPSARFSHSMVYDSNADRVVLFGGFTSGGFSDYETWGYDLATNTWTNLNPAPGPSARSSHSMVYDSIDRKIILFGGVKNTGLLNDEMWTFDLATHTWEILGSPTRPSARSGHSMTYDSAAHKVVMFGGYDSGGEDDETWYLPLNRYYETGQFDSQFIDLDHIYPLTGRITWWHPFAQPVGTVLEIQMGFSNTTDPEDFIYTSPSISYFSFEGTARYLRYRAIFESDPSYHALTSQLESVTIDYSLGMPDYMEVFLDYLDGNATLLADVVDQLGGNATLLETTVALATQNVEYLTSLNATLAGNITLLWDIVNQLGIVVGDADYDGLSDLDELAYGTNLLCIDTDFDNLIDSFEVKIGTDPLDDDSDGDGYYDGIEVAAATDPLSADDYPGKETSTGPTTPDDGGGIPGYPLVIFSLVSMIGLLGILRSLRGKRVA